VTAVRLLIVHLYRLWRTGQSRFRLETYGLYYPGFPYERPLWAVNPAVLVMFARHLPSYTRWVRRMEGLRSRGPGGWWRDAGYEIGEVLDEWNQ
jgi:hypothetical protein